MTAVTEALPTPMNLLDFLSACSSVGLSLGEPRRAKLARHASPQWDLEALRRVGQFEVYQARQAKGVFVGADYLVSFMGEAGSRSRFLGVYEIGECNSRPRPFPEDFLYPEMDAGSCIYELRKRPEFGVLEDRLVIDWGAGTRSWVQWMKPKEVVELRPKGHARDFPGYLDFLIDFAELRRIVEHPDANRTWHSMLCAVAGVYLITDVDSGELYVGSAYGRDEILGRWASYVRSKHGNNKLLRRVLQANPEQYRSWRFSILRTLPRTLTDREVIEVEAQFKAKRTESHTLLMISNKSEPHTFVSVGIN